MKRQIIAAVMVSVASFTSGAMAAEIVKILEQAYEVGSLQITMFSAERGRIVASKCDQCTTEVLVVTEDTRLFKGEEELPLAQAANFANQAGVVFRDSESMNVTRIWIY